MPAEIMLRALSDARAAWLADNSDTTLDHHIKVVVTAALASFERQGWRLMPAGTQP